MTDVPSILDKSYSNGSKFKNSCIRFNSSFGFESSLSYSTKDALIDILIKNLHEHSAKFISQTYDIIYIGFVNNKGNINSKEMNTIKDNLLKILCHTDFLDLLKYYTIFILKVTLKVN